MKKPIDLDKWNRKDHFLFFSKFDEPFFGVTVKIDCTIAFKLSKERKVSFFLWYLFRALKTANELVNFKYRIIDGLPVAYDTINASPTINRPDGTFGFAYFDYYADENDFYYHAQNEIKKVQQSTVLIPSKSEENLIHFSALPWIDFTSISHARNYSASDSCPKISFGKMTENNGIMTMPVSVHVHHALMDGYHVAQFIDKFQKLMNEDIA